MRDPAFWWRGGAAGALLAPLGALYGAVSGARMQRTGASAGMPVICVGNLTLGGTGKTPTAIAIAQRLAQAGERPVFLSRGYGGTQAGPLRVDATSSAADVGDEPLLLARTAPVIVSRDRPAGAAMARATGASVIVMDDGLQNPSLTKDLALAVIDGPRGIGNGRIFPAGPLRAPLATQLDHVHALLIVGEMSGTSTMLADTASERGIAIFRARLAPDEAALNSLRARKALAFAGIGDPDKFFATLAHAGIEAPVRKSFADHHRYTAQEAVTLLSAAEHDSLQLVTTEKDLARMAGDPALRDLAAHAQVLPVRLALENDRGFTEFVLGKIRR
jgi:tetraacyldisaccharide 4'-kinase